MQETDKLTRDFFLRPRKEDLQYFGIADDEDLHLQKPLYGICDAGNYWGKTFIDHIKTDLNVTPLDGDPSMYIKENDQVTIGVLGSYVGDNLIAGVTLKT